MTSRGRVCLQVSRVAAFRRALCRLRPLCDGGLLGWWASLFARLFRPPESGCPWPREESGLTGHVLVVCACKFSGTGRAMCPVFREGTMERLVKYEPGRHGLETARG